MIRKEPGGIIGALLRRYPPRFKRADKARKCNPTIIVKQHFLRIDRFLRELLKEDECDQ